MSVLPTIKFGKFDITRLIIGGNPFCGYSHFSEEMSREMAGYFTAGKVVETLQQAESAGINTVQARGDYHRMLHWIELYRRQGGQMHWIAQTASEMHDVFQNIKIITAAGAIGIYHHGSRTDNLWLDGQIDKVNDYLKCMRDSGVMVGLGTHIPDVIKYAEDKGWDIDFYMSCLYNISRKKRESNLVKGTFVQQEEEFIPSDPDEMCKVIRQTDKLCLAFKILAANRNCSSQEDVYRAFEFAFGNIKPTDAIVVGMYPKRLDQVSLNVRYVSEILTNQKKE